MTDKDICKQIVRVIYYEFTCAECTQPHHTICNISFLEDLLQAYSTGALYKQMSSTVCLKKNLQDENFANSMMKLCTLTWDWQAPHHHMLIWLSSSISLQVDLLQESKAWRQIRDTGWWQWQSCFQTYNAGYPALYIQGGKWGQLIYWVNWLII